MAPVLFILRSVFESGQVPVAVANSFLGCTGVSSWFLVLVDPAGLIFTSTGVLV